MRATMVSFTPGARTAWHSHPVGQVLYCVSGVGRLCLKGQPPQVLNPGDTGIIPPNTLALARRRARSPVRPSRDVGERRSRPGHGLVPACQRRGIRRAGHHRLTALTLNPGIPLVPSYSALLCRPPQRQPTVLTASVDVQKAVCGQLELPTIIVPCRRLAAIADGPHGSSISRRPVAGVERDIDGIRQSDPFAAAPSMPVAGPPAAGLGGTRKRCQIFR